MVNLRQVFEALGKPFGIARELAQGTLFFELGDRFVHTTKNLQSVGLTPQALLQTVEIAKVTAQLLDLAVDGKCIVETVEVDDQRKLDLEGVHKPTNVATLAAELLLCVEPRSGLLDAAERR
jgi:hypothetical protein